MSLENYFKTNKETWNTKVDIHAKSEFYALEAFKKGQSSLNKFELDALGNVKGKSLLHLQCHFGQDTLSFSRLGAKCTGVDISDKAINLAQKINTNLNLDAEFVCCNVLETSQHISDKFDIIYTSYGTIGWLPDLKPWAKMIKERLKPNGVFYIVEFHPIVWMFEYKNDIAELKYSYHQKEVIYEEYEGTYADVNSKMVSKEYWWNHGLGEVVTALTEAGLYIDFLKEHDESPYSIFPGLVKNENNLYVTQDKLYPLLFEMKAHVPA